MLKVWSLKKDEETAKKKKPKTSPAQLRVQKGAFSSCRVVA
jgi:ubiquitin-conjugating enzyme E2 M